MTTPVLELREVAFAYGIHGFKLDPMSLAIEPGSYVAIVGPNAAGKSTLLKVIGGFLRPSRGQVLVAGEDITNRPPGRRSMCTVFQDGALIPHMTAEENVAFGLRARGEKTAANVRAAELLAKFGLGSADRKKKPPQLSGGQRQRVALARAVAVAPRILLLDEPLASIDDPSRDEFEALLFSLRRDPSTAILEVTHLHAHALAVSTHVAFMSAGQLRQFAQPQHIYRYPVDVHCAQFFGPNILDGTIEHKAGEQAVFRSHCGFTTRLSSSSATGPAKVLVRPEALRFTATTDTSNASDATVTTVAFRGDHWEYTCALAEAERLIVMESAYNAPHQPDEKIQLHWRTRDIHVLPS